MSTINKSEFEKYLPSFKELAQTMKVLGASVKIDK
jgi:hypothetical protein